MKVTYKYACDHFKTPEQWLEFHFSHYGAFDVEYQRRGFFSKWKKYGTKEYKDYFIDFLNVVPNNRIIFDCEVVIDIDTETPYENKKLSDIISTIFRNADMTHSVWKSGSGNGHHIHLWFPEIHHMNERDRVHIKKLILTHFCGSYYTNKRIVDLSAARNSKLIALEWSLHRNSNWRKRLVSSYFSKKKKDSSIPKEVLDKFYKEKKEISLSLQKTSNADFKPSSSSIKPAIIDFLESQEFADKKDGRRNALFCLANYYKTRMSDEELFLYLCNWRDTLLPDYKKNLPDWEIKSVISTVKWRMKENKMKELMQGIYTEVIKHE